jgi:AraC family L-rhamnose operon transcriptional activator RhaR
MQDTEYAVRAGDVFVAKPGQPHEIISSEEDPLGIYFWSYTLVPTTRRHEALGGSDALLHAFLIAGQWVSDRVPTMQPTLDLLVEEIVRKQPGYVQAINGLVVKLLLDTARAVVDVPITAEPAGGGPADALASQIAGYLRDNYNRPITIRDVAAQVHLSERHTSRLFRETMGASIKAYLTALRMEIAAQLLLDRRLSIQDVALASGYPDTHYFSTLFHRRMGSTPGCFRHTNGTRMLARSG